MRDIPMEFDAIVFRCLDGHRERRYANTANVAAALENVVHKVNSRYPPTNPHRAAIVESPDVDNLSHAAQVVPVPAAAKQAPARSYTRQGTEKMPNPAELRGLSGTHVILAKPHTPTAPAKASSPLAGRKEPIERRTREETRGPESKPEVAIDDSAVRKADERHDGTNDAYAPRAVGTTSQQAALSTAEFVGTPLDPTAARRLKRKRSSHVLFALTGLGLAAALSLMVLVVNAAKTNQPNALDDAGAPSPNRVVGPQASVAPSAHSALSKPPLAPTTPSSSVGPAPSIVVPNDASPANPPPAPSIIRTSTPPPAPKTGMKCTKSGITKRCSSTTPKKTIVLPF